MDIRTYKNELRAMYSEKRNSLPTDEKTKLDDKIANRFLNMLSYRYANQILFYASTDAEISTVSIFEQALKAGKACYFPKCYENSQMSFYRVNSPDELVTDAFNIKAPVNESDIYTPQPSDIIIVPAMAYDVKGFRLGYGKGYYDRYLSRYEGSTVGICYEENITEELFHGKYDRAVDLVLTEKHITVIEMEV